MFLITGCGRSGTKYMTKVLRQAGLDVWHESAAGVHGVVSSVWAAKAVTYPSYHEQWRPNFDFSLHQVRFPPHAISSLVTASEESMLWNCGVLNIDDRILRLPMGKLKWATEYWVQQNLLAESTAEYTYKIESLEEAWPILRAYLRIKVSYQYATLGISTSTNTREHDDYDLADILKFSPFLESDIYAMMERYGYL